MRAKSLLLLITLFFYTEYVKPITQEHANTGSAIVASIAGLSAYIAMPSFRVLSFLSVGGLVFYTTRYCLNCFTPNGRIERAENYLTTIVGYTLASTPQTEKELLFNQVYALYASNSCPLTQAVTDLNYFINLSVTVVGLINAAMEEDSSLINYAQILKDSAKYYALQMKQVLSIVLSSKEYIEERRYQEMLHVQQSMAEAQWSNAVAQHQIAAKN